MKKLISLFLCIVFLLSSVPFVAYGQEIDRGILYVATNGKDTNEGTIDKPLATLHGARDKIRALKKAGVEYKKGIVVYVREGNYTFSSTLELTEEDSGTEQAPIVYRAYPGEKVTLLGGVNVSGNQFQKISDKAILNRIVEPSARDKIYEVDLKKLGIHNVGEPYLLGANGYPPSYVEAGILKKPNSGASEVLFNGEAMQMARYPNVGSNMKIDKVLDQGHYDFAEDGNINKFAPFSITTTDERLSKWTQAKPDSIIMYGYWRFEWADAGVPVRKIDPGKGQLDSAWGHIYGVLSGKEFYVYNLLEEIDVPGEYFLDTDNCILYFYPPSSISGAEVLLTLLDGPMITVNGDHIKFRDFNVMGTRNNAFVLNGTFDEISNCEISCTSSAAVVVRGSNSGIRDSYLHDVDTGITLSAGTTSTLTNGEAYAINNEIERFARLTKTYAAAINVGGVGNIAMHNEIHEASHLAISFSGNNNRICYNDIYDVVRFSDDAAAIYGGLNWVGRGNEIKYNYIHDIASSSTGSAGVSAVYLDGGQCETFVIGNVVSNVPNGFLINGGRDNVILNNVLLNCANGLKMTDEMLVVDLERNHYTSLNNAPYVQSEIWKKAFPKLDAMITDEGRLVSDEMLLPQDNVFQNNVLFRTPASSWKGTAGDYIDISNNFSTKKDPGFYNINNKNYLLKKDAEVFKELPDFQALPFTRMGRCDELGDVRVQDAIVLILDSPNSLVNGKMMSIDSENPAVTPKIINDFTYVPLRFVSESLGMSVNYDAETGKITIAGGDTVLELYAGKTEALINGESITMNNAAVIEEGRTLVPLREISNLLGKKVFWNDIGFIVVSDDETLFDETDVMDEAIMRYLHGKINIY